MFKATFNIVRRSLYNNARTLYCLPINFTYNNSTKSYSVQNHCNLYIAKRFKSSNKNKRKQSQNQESFNEEEDIVEEEAPAGSKIITINIQSIRLDAISKIAFGLSRNKIEEVFYASKIRLNEQKVFKKSKELDIGDQVDLILHRSENNSSFLVIHRIIILSMVPSDNNIKIKISRDRNLLIENYKDPWLSE
ncbi:mitochondrial transcription rescue factor 1 [Odontomachus brunneus]|uniref:mitochondrial transcription rescue factor 1 n=1 Tax=Odontomachus brunneus TaxID=486640 RepID=UPI0013F27CFB|nr:mitochondrial transcription rescue factor 1 [Odontomachus brunneus]